jgi:ornithine cyclodeaminase
VGQRWFGETGVGSLIQPYSSKGAILLPGAKKMRIVALNEILEALSQVDLIPSIEAGFVAYSNGQAIVPPVGELLLDHGDVHIKYGCLKGDEYYVIKIASGFYDNPQLGLPSGNGLMLLFSQRTGELVSLLLDEGHLTDVRTGVAGSIAAKHLAPKVVERIGIVGAGIQGRQQLRYLEAVTTCRDILVWAKLESELPSYKTDMELLGFRVEGTLDTALIPRSCNLIVTCTPSVEPLIHDSEIQAGTHITAVGSDTADKQELESAILGRADLVVADSIEQCLMRGEIFQAIRSGQISETQLVELGNLISGKAQGRISEDQITVADLTGVAVQDIKIATAVFRQVASKSNC